MPKGPSKPNPPDENLYVIARGTEEIHKFDGTTGAFIKIFEGFTLDAPFDITIGPGDLFYITNEAGDSISTFDVTGGGGVFDTFVPSGGFGLDGPLGIVFGPDDAFYISNGGSNEVLRLTFGGGSPDPIFVTAGLGGLNFPTDLVFGPFGNLYVGSAVTDEVLKYQGPGGANPGEFMGAFVTSRSGDLDGPFGLAFGPHGTFFVSSARNDKVLEYDGISGAFLGRIASDDLSTPWGLVFGSDDNLYVSSFSNNQIRQYDTFFDIFIRVFNGMRLLQNVRGFDFDPDGFLYVSSKDSDEILRYDLNGKFTNIVIEDKFSPNQNLRPAGLVFDSDRTFYFLGDTFNPSQRGLYRSDANGNLICELIGFTNFPTVIPKYVALEPSTKLVFVSGGLGIDVYDSINLPGRSPTNCSFVKNLVSDGDGGLDNPRGLAFGPNGDLYVISSATDEILRFDSFDGTPLGVFASDNLDNPFDLAFGPFGNLYVVDNKRVKLFDGATGVFISDYSMGGNLISPKYLRFDHFSNLYVSDSFNNEIQRFEGPDPVPPPPPPPPPPDPDNDGIADEIDTLPGIFSNFFEDIPLGGTTEGEIVTRAGRTVLVTEEPNPDGVLVTTEPTGGRARAEINMCNGDTFVFIDDVVDSIILTCFNPVILNVVGGMIEVSFTTGGPPATTTLITGDFVTFDPDRLTITTGPGTTITVEIDGEEFTIEEDQTVKLDIRPDTPIGGTLIPIDATSLLLANTQSFSWMIPVLLSGIGIGLFVVSRKS